MSLLTRSARIELIAAAVVAVVAATAIDSRAADPTTPSIYVTYHINCTFTITVDPGLAITSPTGPGPTVPPGSYQLVVFMPNPADGYAPCAGPRFSLTGPGVSARITFGGEELTDEHHRPILQPGSTYVAQDENAPAQTRRVFSTAGSGSSSSLLGPAGTTGGTAKGSVQPGLVGSARLRFRGKLVATVTAAGKATVKRSGRRVVSLKAGTYELTVADASKRAGLFVRRGSRSPVTVSSVRFVGKRTQRVALPAGSWTLFSMVGAPTRFTVVA